jgi:hypothetical protein
MFFIFFIFVLRIVQNLLEKILLPSYEFIAIKILYDTSRKWTMWVNTKLLLVNKANHNRGNESGICINMFNVHVECTSLSIQLAIPSSHNLEYDNSWLDQTNPYICPYFYYHMALYTLGLS